MTVQPPSDIVLDVARAADSARYQAAATKLAQGSPATFTDALGEAVAARVGIPAALQPSADTVLTRFRTAATQAAPNPKGSPAQQFEAFILQSFVESMLPQGAAAVFGKGNAGSIWRSMLAEQLGGQLAKAGGIGIARMIDRAHPGAGEPMPAARTKA